MTYLIRGILFVAILAVVLPRPAAAHSGYWRVSDTAGNGLRLRTGPGGTYRIIEVMPRGDRLKAFGHSGGWIKVRHLATGSVGWASLSWVVSDSGSTQSPPPSGGGSGLQLCWDSSFGVVYCAAPWIAQAIYEAAQYYGVPYWALMGIASCESGFDPNAWAYSPPDNVYGIFQFRPSTMAWVYPGGNVWSVHDSAWAAARLLTIAPAQFDCSWRIGYV